LFTTNVDDTIFNIASTEQANVAIDKTINNKAISLSAYLMVFVQRRDRLTTSFCTFCVRNGFCWWGLKLFTHVELRWGVNRMFITTWPWWLFDGYIQFFLHIMPWVCSIFFKATVHIWLSNLFQTWELLEYANKNLQKYVREFLCLHPKTNQHPHICGLSLKPTWHCY
jgi:hypothetical protein